MSSSVRQMAKRVLPSRMVGWYRRRRELRIYLRTLGDELFRQRVRLSTAQAEGGDAQREALYVAGLGAMIERTDIVLQELDRRIEGLTARHGTQLRTLRDEAAALRDRLVALENVVARLARPDQPPDDAGDREARDGTASERVAPAGGQHDRPG